jgi:predicted metal-dependent phosphoesterase TrpH
LGFGGDYTMLKADFHIHTHEDPADFWLVKYSAKDLIRLAAKQKFEVLSITNHNHVFYNRLIKSYAWKKGILLIPGAEARIEGKDVLILNISNEQLARIKKLDDLEKIKDSSLIIAPHPYFWAGYCLKNKLIEHMHNFHAIEFSHFYTKAFPSTFFRFLAGNSKAVEVAKKYKKPLIGTSDAHKLYEFGITYTLVNSRKNKEAVIDAVKHNKIRLADNPMPGRLFLRRALGAILKEGFLERVALRNHIRNKRKAAIQKI